MKEVFRVLWLNVFIATKPPIVPPKSVRINKLRSGIRFLLFLAAFLSYPKTKKVIQFAKTK